LSVSKAIKKDFKKNDIIPKIDEKNEKADF